MTKKVLNNLKLKDIAYIYTEDTPSIVLEESLAYNVNRIGECDYLIYHATKSYKGIDVSSNSICTYKYIFSDVPFGAKRISSTIYNNGVIELTSLEPYAQFVFTPLPTMTCKELRELIRKEGLTVDLEDYGFKYLRTKSDILNALHTISEE